MTTDTAHPLVGVVSRTDVEAADPTSTLNVLSRLLESPEIAKNYHERVDIAFHGYDHDRRELFEIPEVREFVARLDASFPYWLFFLSKHSTGLQALAFCFLPPFLPEEAKRSVWPQRLSDLVARRWGPALTGLAANLGYTHTEIDNMMTDAGHYFLEGPRLPYEPTT
jgi:hypothetical protein